MSSTSPFGRLRENTEQIVPRRGVEAERLAGERSHSGLSPDVQIFDRALAVDPCQAAGRGVAVRSSYQRGPGGGRDAPPIQITLPEEFRHFRIFVVSRRI